MWGVCGTNEHYAAIAPVPALYAFSFSSFLPAVLYLITPPPSPLPPLPCHAGVPAYELHLRHQGHLQADTTHGSHQVKRAGEGGEP